MSEQELLQFREQLNHITEILKVAPNNHEAIELQKQLIAAIKELEESAEESPSVAPPAPAAAQEGKGSKPAEKKPKFEFQKGQFVIAKFPADGRFYTARVNEVDNARHQCNVAFIGYPQDQSHRVSMFEMRPFKQPDLTLISVGGKCEAVNAHGEWAPAVLDAISKSGTYWVAFQSSKGLSSSVAEVEGWALRPTMEAVEKKREELKMSGKKRERMQQEAEDQAQIGSWKAFQSKAMKEGKIGGPAKFARR